LEGLTAAHVVQAMQIYLSIAYSSGNVPENRRHFSQIGASHTLEECLALKGVEQLPSNPGVPPGYSLRMGNAFYPHMKLTIQPYDSAPGFVFGIDTHDQFKLAETSPEKDAVRALQTKNQQIARSIEMAWEEVGLPTQSGLLRKYLAARRARQEEGTQS
jgi:hypothetical protein